MGRWPLSVSELKLHLVPSGPVGELCLLVQIIKFPEQFDSRFLLKISFENDLEVANVGDRIGLNILRMKLEEL